MKSTVLRLAATLSFAAMVAVNALANILPINGLNTGEVSALYPSLFTPAGLTFSIWSVIYILLGGFIVISWMQRANKRIDRVLAWFILTCVFNIGWILVWHHLLTALSVIIMLALLSVLILIFRIVHESPWQENKLQIWIVLPFTIYLAWITVATIANISALLVSLEWNGGFLSQQTWTVIMMTIATLLAFKITFDYKVPFFAVVVMWALFGIYFRWRGGDFNIITYTSVLLMTLLGLGISYIMRKRTSS
jgi:benzodiazapine receptor